MLFKILIDQYFNLDVAEFVFDSFKKVKHVDVVDRIRGVMPVFIF